MTAKRILPRAENLMNRHVHAVTPDMGLANVVKVLLQHKISCAPVVNEIDGGRRILIGFVSEQDCLEHLSNEMFHGNPRPQQTASTIMKKHPICVAVDTDVFTLSSIFVSHGFRHLPVVDSDNHLLGLISRREILKALECFYDQTNDAYQIEHFPPDVHQIINHRFLMRDD
ncbi:MAG: CBS domain-containing protein [Planctomycetaceae bacterium]|nr:CBS domain-containing protein [Planctomycetaceae bacterium]